MFRAFKLHDNDQLADVHTPYIKRSTDINSDIIPIDFPSKERVLRYQKKRIRAKTKREGNILTIINVCLEGCQAWRGYIVFFLKQPENNLYFVKCKTLKEKLNFFFFHRKKRKDKQQIYPKKIGFFALNYFIVYFLFYTFLACCIIHRTRKRTTFVKVTLTL